MITQTLPVLLMIAVGAGCGFLFGKLQTCSDGTCPLTATPTRSALWGGLIGLMAALNVAPQWTSRYADAAEEGAKDKLPYVSIASEAQFKKEILDRKGVAVVDFFATWCGPCRTYAPTFKKVAQAQAKQARFAKVDTDKNAALSSRHGVQYLPTTLIFKDGKVVKSMVGLITEKELLKEIAKAAKTSEKDKES